MGDAVRDRLVQVGDLHFWRLTFNPFRQLSKRALGNANLWWRRRHEFEMAAAATALDEVIVLGIPDVLFTGDFTTTSLPEEFEMARALLERAAAAGLRPIAVPGNHDVYTFGAQRRDEFRRHLGQWAGNAPLPFVHRLTNGTPLLLAPTAVANRVSSKGRIHEDEIAAVQQLLGDLNEPVIVAGHYPLLNETEAYAMSPSRRLRGAEALRAVLGNCGLPVIYLCGHVHRFSYVRDPLFPNVHHVTTGTLFGHNPAQQRRGEFTEVHALEDGWAVFNHVNDGAWRRSEMLPV
jgi:3',5'-cyclic AMP phosphodiesterase CpdA